MRILLVEDSSELLQFVKIGLEGQGYVVDGFETVGDSDAAMAVTSYDAVILDLGLPDGDGLDLLRSWRNRGVTAPVLILTERDTLDDRIKGLDGGGDDYLIKPFDLEELQARLRALLRRPKAALGAVITVGNISLDSTSREIRIERVPVAFPRRETAILEQLMRRCGTVVPKEILVARVYSFDDDVTLNSLEAGVSRLRKRLGKLGSGVTIRTLRGVGYLLVEDHD